MPIQANAARLKSRLRDIENATRLAPYALSTVAQETIGDVRDNASQRLEGRDDQVGFDLPQFLQTINQPGPLSITGARGGRGSIGILDQTQMGTLDDFDAISGDPKLWHTGRGFAELFRLRVFVRPDKRASLAEQRQQIWGTKTPQWYLMENGYSGSDAFPPVPAGKFIASATRADRMTLRLRNAMTSLYRGIPRK
jgi:hypothetical protein